MTKKNLNKKLNAEYNAAIEDVVSMLFEMRADGSITKGQLPWLISAFRTLKADAE